MFDAQYYKRVIFRSYGLNVDFADQGKALRKFGTNTDIDTGVREQVWRTGGSETLSTTNNITHFASSDAGDTQEIVVEGHTIDGSGNLTFVVQTATLAGQTKTALTTPLARITRLYNNGSTDFAGTVTVAEDVTFTGGVPASDIHLTCVGERNQSQKCATSVSQFQFYVITEAIFTVRRANAAVVDFEIQIRLQGKVFRTQLAATVSNSSGTVVVKLDDAPIICPPNTDIRVLATSNANNVEVGAEFNGRLAKIV